MAIHKSSDGREFQNSLQRGDFGPTLDRLRPFVMPPVSTDALVDIANLVRLVITCGIPGDFVECGVWRGGTAFLMAELLRQAGLRDRKVWLFDSFEGMPPVEEIDGPAAIAEANDPDSPLYIEHSRVPLEEVQRTANELGLASYLELVKGWFSQTLPAARDRVRSIALLHIDCDWYSSVRCCLDNFYDLVADGGFVFLDDYYHYDGCAIAVHEFLGERRTCHRIESVRGQWGGCEYDYAARIRKGEANWKWGQLSRLATQDIAAIISPEDAFIFVGKELLGTEITTGRRAIPFLERDGQYWGEPAHDEAAIRELERSRESGVSFIVFPWTAFWWLDYFSGLNQHLRSQFRCVLENERLVMFDLRG